MYLRLTTFTKTLPQMSFHLYFLLFLCRSGAPPMTLLTAGALTDPRLPATASNVCTTDARLGGVGRVPPKSWLRRCLSNMFLNIILPHSISTSTGLFWDDFQNETWSNPPIVIVISLFCNYFNFATPLISEVNDDCVPTRHQTRLCRQL